MNEIFFVDPYESKESLDIFKTILPEDFDEENKSFSMIGACDETGTMLGVLGFDDLGEQCNILWLFIEPFARRMGVASALIEELIRYYCDNNDVKPIVFRYENHADCSIHEFFKVNPYFDVLEGYRNYSAGVGDISKTDEFEAMKKDIVPVERFFDLSPARQQAFLQEIREEGYYDVRDYKEWSGSCISELSLCTVEEYAVKSAIFMKRIRESEYEIAFVYATNPLHLYSIIKGAIETIMDLDPDATVTASIMNEIAGQIFNKVFTKVVISKPILMAEWNYEVPDVRGLEDTDDEMDDYEVVELW